MQVEFKQQRSLFIRNVLAFGLIFILLGLIVNQVLVHSLYRDVDNELTRFVQDKQALRHEIELVQHDAPPQNGEMAKEPPPPRNSFKTQLILWSRDGDILNQALMGDRYQQFSQLTLATTKLDKVTPLEITDTGNNKLNFRSILTKTTDPKVAYVQFLSNTNQTEDTLVFFRRVLIGCMFIFWLIAIFVSYYLAKLNMQPILLAWEKQQTFVQNSSHELKTPLTIIQSKLEKLLTQPNHTILEEAETIAITLNEVRRITQLTDDLLILAQSDSNQLVLVKEALTSHDFLASVLTPYQEIAQSQDKHLVISEAGDYAIMIDPKLMTQLLIILVDNALKYTGEGDTIVVDSRMKDNHWLLSVCDTGIGLDTIENKELIFQRFYREDQARQRKTGGYGLGLSIAKWIVTAHAGKISVEMNEPKGTKFMVSLPLKIK